MLHKQHRWACLLFVLCCSLKHLQPLIISYAHCCCYCGCYVINDPTNRNDATPRELEWFLCVPCSFLPIVPILTSIICVYRCVFNILCAGFVLHPRTVDEQYNAHMLQNVTESVAGNHSTHPDSTSLRLMMWQFCGVKLHRCFSIYRSRSYFTAADKQLAAGDCICVDVSWWILWFREILILHHLSSAFSMLKKKKVHEVCACIRCLVNVDSVQLHFTFL